MQENQRDNDKSSESESAAKNLMAGFDDARQPQETRTTAYRVVSPFADHAGQA